MKLPPNVDGLQLVKALAVLGYEVTRQKGSHVRVTTQRDGENHEVIPCHRPITAVPELLYPGSTLSSGIFLKKMPPCAFLKKGT